MPTVVQGVHRERIDMGMLSMGGYLYRETSGSRFLTRTLHLIMQSTNISEVSRRLINISSLAYYLLIVSWLSTPWTASAQVEFEVRRPVPETYVVGDHPGGSSFYDVAQDDRGVLFIANAEGLLEFDGTQWRMLDMPFQGSRTFHAVERDSAGVFYAGGQGIFGRLERGENGLTEFHSMMDILDPPLPLTSSVWDIVVREEGVYFLADSVLIGRLGDQTRTWRAPGGLSRIYSDKQNLFVVAQTGHVYRVRADSLEEMRELTRFMTSFPVSILPVDGRYQLSLYDGRVFWWQPGTIPVARPLPFDDYLVAHLIEGVVPLEDGTLLFRTWRKGAIWSTSEGIPIAVLDDDIDRFPSGVVNNAYQDRDGNTWISTSTGLVRTDLKGSVHDLGGLPGGVGDITGLVRHDGRLFVFGDAGLFEVMTSVPSGSSFDQVDMRLRRIEQAVSIGETLYIRASNEWWAWNRGRLTQTSIEGGTMMKDPWVDNRVLSASSHGIASWQVRADDGQLMSRKLFTEPFAFSELIADSTGVVWGLFEPAGIVRIDRRYSSDHPDHSAIWHHAEDFDPEIIDVVWHEKEPLFMSDQGVYRFDESHARFFRPVVPEAGQWRQRFGSKSAVHADGAYSILTETERGLISGLVSGESPGVIPKTGGVRVGLIERRNGTAVAWGVQDGRLIRVDHFERAQPPTDWEVLVTGVFADGKRLPISYSSNAELSFEAGVQDLLFEIAIPRFTASSGSHMSYRLTSQSDVWSSWEPVSAISFSRLDPGRYDLQVRGLDGQAQVSSVLRLPFRILAPWYATTWAWIAWSLLAVGVVAGSSIGWQGYRNRVLIQRTRELEASVAKRTLQLREAKEESEQQAAKLRELDEAKSRFFANVSHEFRTPLTLISAPIQDALDKEFGPLSDAAIVAFERASRNADRLHRLINQLLDLARLEAGTLKAQTDRIDLTDSIRLLVSLFESVAVERKMTLRVETEPPHVWATCDPEHLEKIVVNLLSNALKFTPEGGHITIAVGETNGTAVVKVEDNGIGIPEPLQERVFERFFQVDDSSVRQRDGMGIGLAMSRELARSMHGDLTLESAYGKGAVFTLTLPLTEPDETHRSETVSDDIVRALAHANASSMERRDKLHDDHVDAEETASDRPSLLIIEDNPDLQDYLSERFREKYDITVAPDGRAGVRIAKESMPDMIISDVMMPYMDGIEVCDALKTELQTSHIPIVLLTALSDVEHRIQGLEAGADAYLAKPFRVDELRAVLSNLDRRRQRLHEVYGQQQLGAPVEPDDELMLTPRDRAFLEQASQIISDSFASASFGVDQLAEELHLSRRQVHRKLKALTGNAPKEMILSRRMHAALTLLRDEGVQVKEVADRVGYQSRSQFSRQFQEFFGMRPSDVE